MPDELSPQVPVLIEVLAAAGIDRVGAPGYEADDVIGTLATRARGPVDVVTGDRDLFQLVDDDAACGSSTPPAASPTSSWSTRRRSPRSTASRPRLRRLRRPARRPERRPARRRRRRREDRRGADQRVRRPGRHPRRGRADRRPEPPLTAAVLKKMHAAAAYLDAAPVVVAVARTIDLPPIEGTLPRSPADPADWPGWLRRTAWSRRSGGWAPRWAGRRTRWPDRAHGSVHV